MSLAHSTCFESGDCPCMSWLSTTLRRQKETAVSSHVAEILSEQASEAKHDEYACSPGEVVFVLHVAGDILTGGVCGAAAAHATTVSADICFSVSVGLSAVTQADVSVIVLR